MIIAICGGDASGKATQSKLLAERLKGTRFAFPNYDSPAGKLILDHLQKKWHLPDKIEDAMVFQSLMTVNRLEIADKITAAHERGPVIFDRWYVSALVYGKLDGLDVDWLKSVQIPMFEPDLWILIDVPVEEGFKRRPERRDRYESNREYMEKVREEYLKLWRGRERRRWCIVNGCALVEEVHNRVMDCVRMYIASVLTSPGNHENEAAVERCLKEGK